MYTKAAQQYDHKVKADLLNQLPFIFDKTLKGGSITSLLTKYYIFHHYGLTLNGKGKPITKEMREFETTVIDVRRITINDSFVARKIYQLEFEQTKYFLSQINKIKPLNATNILDIGSGSGGMTFYLADNFSCQVDSLNLSKKQAKLIANIAKIRLIGSRVNVLQNNMNEIQKVISPKKYDFILQNETDQYVDNLGDFIPQIAALLNPNAIYATIGWYKTRDSLNTKVIDNYYFTKMKSIKELEITYAKNKLKIIGRQDLTVAAKPYWYIRNVFGLSKGIVEAEFIGGLENGSIKYMLYIISK